MAVNRSSIEGKTRFKSRERCAFGDLCARQDERTIDFDCWATKYDNGPHNIDLFKVVDDLDDSEALQHQNSAVCKDQRR